MEPSSAFTGIPTDLILSEAWWAYRWVYLLAVLWCLFPIARKFYRRSGDSAYCGFSAGLGRALGVPVLVWCLFSLRSLYMCLQTLDGTHAFYAAIVWWHFCGAIISLSALVVGSVITASAWRAANVRVRASTLELLPPLLATGTIFVLDFSLSRLFSVQALLACK